MSAVTALLTEDVEAILLELQAGKPPTQPVKGKNGSHFEGENVHPEVP